MTTIRYCSAVVSGLVGLTVCSLALTATSCRPSARPTGPMHILGGIDHSRSVRKRGILGPAVLQTVRLAGRLEEGSDRITLFRVGWDTQEFSDREAPASSMAFQQMLMTALKAPPARQGTLPARFWTTVAARAETIQHPIGIICFSDGDNDDHSLRSRRTIQAAARKLACNPRVTVVAVYGAVPKNWAWLREAFQPLGDRFLLRGPSEMEIEPFLQRVNQARR